MIHLVFLACGPIRPVEHEPFFAGAVTTTVCLTVPLNTLSTRTLYVVPVLVIFSRMTVPTNTTFARSAALESRSAHTRFGDSRREE